MQVARHVGSQTGGRRRADARLQGKVVSTGLLHAEITEIEVLGAKVVCTSEERLGLRQVTAITPGAGNWGRVHSGKRRRHLHGGEGEGGLSSYRATGRNERRLRRRAGESGLIGVVSSGEGDKAYKTEKLIPI